GSQMWPEPCVRVSSIFQQPAFGNTKPVPHSWPGLRQLDPPCSSGPQISLALVPPGRLALTVSGPPPVIRPTAFTSSPRFSGVARTNSNAHSSAPSAVPRTSGNPSPRYTGVPLHPTPLRVGLAVAASCASVAFSPASVPSAAFAVGVVAIVVRASVGIG